MVLKKLEMLIAGRRLMSRHGIDRLFYIDVYGVCALADAGVVYSGDDARFFAE